LVCAVASLLERISDGTKKRLPPCSSPPRAATICGLCAVVMVAELGVVRL
jgi:hypothetical protein